MNSTHLAGRFGHGPRLGRLRRSGGAWSAAPAPGDAAGMVFSRHLKAVGGWGVLDKPGHFRPVSVPHRLLVAAQPLRMVFRDPTMRRHEPLRNLAAGAVALSGPPTSLGTSRRSTGRCHVRRASGGIARARIVCADHVTPPLRPHGLALVDAS
jgi:hypothetical protein